MLFFVWELAAGTFPCFVPFVASLVIGGSCVALCSLRLGSGIWPLYFSLICGMCSVCHDFAPPLGYHLWVICCVIVALPGHLLSSLTHLCRVDSSTLIIFIGSFPI